MERLVKAGGPAGYNASQHLAKLDRGEDSKLEFRAHVR
jgi:hypothetical protein